MIIETKKKEKILFIHIGKNAGTSVYKTLIKSDISGRKEERELRIKIKKTYNNQKTFRHYDLQTCQDLGIKLDNYFKFCVVRNPYSRLYSIYNFAIKTGLKKEKSGDGYLKRKDWIFYKKFSNNYNPDLYKFYEWIKYCYNIYLKYKKIYGKDFFLKYKKGDIKFDYEKELCANVNLFLKLQSFYITVNNNILVDKILKFENLNENWESLKKKYDFVDLKMANQTVKKYSNYKSTIDFNSSIKNMIYIVHEEDFKLFNYEK